MSPAAFYDDGQVTLYCADLRAVDVPPGSVAAVVTSPPYNVGVDYDTAPTPWTGWSTGGWRQMPPG